MEEYKKIVENEILEDILFEGRKKRRFKITVCFRENLSEKSKKAVEMVKGRDKYYTEGKGRFLYHCASFFSEEVEELHSLWELIANFEHKKILINNYPLPYSQSLWLLLFWLYRIR